MEIPIQEIGRETETLIPNCKLKTSEEKIPPIGSAEYKVIPKLRKSRVLTPAQFGCLKGIPAVNITSGCIFQCAYCYARGYRQAPPPGEVHLYVNLPALLKEALVKKKILPEWAIVNTSSDCFQSHPDILHVTYDVFRILLDHGIGISFLTKGRIPLRFFDLIGRFPQKIAAQIGLVSLSERYWREYEPGTPSPEERLENVQRLKKIGILPEIRIDPMIPFVTDTEMEATALFKRLKGIGVKKVSLSYLHLRPAIEKQLKKELSPVGRRMIESCFGFKEWKAVGASTMTKLLSKTLREKGYRRISGIGESFGITASVCQCKNPDLKADLCGSTPSYRIPSHKNTEETLFLRYSIFDSIKMSPKLLRSDRTGQGWLEKMISYTNSPKNVVIFDDKDQMLKFMIEKWEDVSKKAIEEHGHFTVALSGGRTPVFFYQKLTEQGGKSSWGKTQVFLVDERFVPFDDKDSNYRMLKETLLGTVAIPQKNIHPIPTESGDLEVSAREYEDHLIRSFKLSKGQYPAFDLILLGIGEDGHTASLFPGSRALNERTHLAAAVVLDRVRHDRITLTLPVINHAQQVIFFVTGEDKAAALKKVIDEKNSSLPASMVQPASGDLLFVIDREAGSHLSG